MGYWEGSVGGYPGCCGRFHQKSLIMINYLRRICLSGWHTISKLRKIWLFARKRPLSIITDLSNWSKHNAASCWPREWAYLLVTHKPCYYSLLTSFWCIIHNVHIWPSAQADSRDSGQVLTFPYDTQVTVSSRWVSIQWTWGNSWYILIDRSGNKIIFFNF